MERRSRRLVMAAVLGIGCGVGSTSAGRERPTTAAPRTTGRPSSRSTPRTPKCPPPVISASARSQPAASAIVASPSRTRDCLRGGATITDREGPYVDLSMNQELSWDYTCAVRASGDPDGLPRTDFEPPKGTYTQVSVGFFSACAVDVGGEIACWAPVELGGVAPPSLNDIPPGSPPSAGRRCRSRCGTAARSCPFFTSRSRVRGRHPSRHAALLRARRRAEARCAITYPDQELWCWAATPDGSDTGERMLDGHINPSPWT